MAMEMVDSSVEFQVPHGGPICLPDLVGQITRVPEFEASVVEEVVKITSKAAFQVETLTEKTSPVQEEEISDEAKNGQYDLSGYFLIEDIFCNDKRDPFVIDSGLEYQRMRRVKRAGHPIW
ncbi:hypothetical protein IFM89_006797 [Coptis chinensis]|uniref:Uncharacterized protein n=1 Tax=Coptis chinensis TaxID=261450 RepID=A0A835LYS7_9MAGN|nr:hypothetical protein IFM89_006797 [Coptis chinensis]